MVEAGKKAAITRATATYTVEEHYEGKSDKITELFIATQDFITNLDPSIEEVPKKQYIAYKTSQNIACVEVQKHQILIFLKLKSNELEDLPTIARDVTNIGHFGTGDLEIRIKNQEELELAKSYIVSSYKKVGS